MERRPIRNKGFYVCIVLAILIVFLIFVYFPGLVSYYSNNRINEQLEQIRSLHDQIRETQSHHGSLITEEVQKHEKHREELDEQVKQCESRQIALDQKIEDLSRDLNLCEHLPQPVITSPDPIPSKYYLVIGIPTIARPHSEDYLTQSLKSLELQLPTNPDHVLYGKVLVIVMNIDKTVKHDRFEEAQVKYSKIQIGKYFHFTTLSDRLTDPNRLNQKDEGNANVPGYKVRQQSRDLVSLLRYTVSRADFSYYMFLEDDMYYCRHFLSATSHMIEKASIYTPDFTAIRASFGMNGITIHQKDVTVFANYLFKHHARRPPDHLAVEWFAGETVEARDSHGTKRRNAAFRYNLLGHIGSVSTLRNQKSVRYPVCYEELQEPVLFKVEAFDARLCPKDDVWPCDSADKDSAMPALDWGRFAQP